MAKKVGAILLDTRSIQKYVFSCNKLKTNVGASYLVDGIFNDLMQNIILPKYNLKMPDISWKKSDGIQIVKDDTIEAEIVYIGGGNMLILINKFPEEDDNLKLCRDIVSSWSLEILKKAPGLKTGAAIGMMDVSEDAFKNSLDDMYVQLKQNQNTVLPQVDLPYTGLTLECDISGKTADTFDWVDKKWIAKEVKAKTAELTFSSLTAFHYKAGNRGCQDGNGENKMPNLSSHSKDVLLFPGRLPFGQQPGPFSRPVTSNLFLTLKKPFFSLILSPVSDIMIW